MGAPTTDGGGADAAVLLQQQQQHPPRSFVGMIDIDDPDPVGSTYASLVQQYLSVLCHDNATFLAERMVARNPSDPHGLYLLATCHYRSGSPKRARSVLLSFAGGDGGKRAPPSSLSNAAPMETDPVDDEEADEEVAAINSGGGGIGGKKRAATAAAASEAEGKDAAVQRSGGIRSAIRYLHAKCCVDLGLLGEAEECLLRECRERFARRVAVASTGAGGGGGGNGERSYLGDMDEWILASTPCPIPNGAAGLNLLGTICRKSNRRRRAIEYYRLSLKLDPLMWTSYEALCELGGGASDDIDDPTLVFGVVPAVLSSPGDGNGGGPKDYDDGARAPLSPAFTLSDTPLGATAADAARGGQEGGRIVEGRRPVDGGGGVVGGRKARVSFGTPSGTPFSGRFGRMDLDDGGNASASTNLPAASLFDTGGRHPPGWSAGGGGPRGRGGAPPSTASRRNNGHLPSASLFNTPGLTPIQRSSDDPDRSASFQHHHHPSGSAAVRLPPTGGGYSRGNNGVPDSAQIAASHSAMARAVAGEGAESRVGGVSRFSASFSSTSQDVLARARQVAARLYYEPSPETTPPNVYATDPTAAVASSMKLQRRHRRRIGGGGDAAAMAEDLNASRAGTTHSTHLSFSSDSSLNVTPGGNGEAASTPLGAAPFNADVSSVHGGKRALFLQSSDKDRREDSDYRSPADPDETVDYNVAADARVDDVAIVHGGEGTRRNGAGPGYHYVLEDGGTGEDGGVQQVLELLCVLGTAQRHLCQYRCRDALRIFHQLPHSQFNTGWVQHQIGRAYFEIADYQNAQRALEVMQRVEPHRVKGLEVLSTTLWHLKKEVELSDLAQRAVEFDKMAPESWCVVGNCFSLQKEHETALAFFRRSNQLDPAFTYSHTLSGHEYVANEDFDKAIACFRDAIRADDRHYNAWYGLGAIYFRQEKFDLAEYHFQKALKINPQSSVLHCHLGMAQHANGKPYDALTTLQGAFRLDPRNPQARYQRATIFMSIDRPEEALTELEKVRDAAPREATVHFSLGRVFKRLGKPEKAMRSFLTALDLDPKDNNLIKAAMDRLDEPDVEEDVSAF